MYNSNCCDLVSELQRKDLIIQSLQNQLRENVSYFRRDPYYDETEKLKNEIKRKDTEIAYLDSKLQTLLNENNKLRQSFCAIKDENFELKLKYTNENQKLNDIIKNSNDSISKYQLAIDDLKSKLEKVSNEHNNCLLDNDDMNHKLKNMNQNFNESENEKKKLQNDLQNWQEKYSKLSLENKENKLKYNKLNDDIMDINEKLVLMRKENDETKDYINKLMADLGKWLKETDFSQGSNGIGENFPKWFADNANINGVDFSPLYDGIISLQENVINEIGNNYNNNNQERNKFDPQVNEDIIQDNVNLIKDNIALKNQLNMKEITIRELKKELNNLK